MARADWGGGSDYSGIFANLHELFQSRVEASTARAKRQAEEERAAADADTYDKWKNGLITDDDWLAYIDQRLEESTGDPKEVAEWTKIKREHETGIRDAQAETAFEDGNISIHAIIGYYKTRIQDVETNSPEYRKLKSRLNDLVENRDSEQIYDEAEAIIDRIERGRGNYTELLNYYKAKLGSLNPNSDLYRQVKREINSIQDIVDAVGTRAGGGSSGGSRRSGGGRSGGRSGGGGGGALPADLMRQVNDLIVTNQRGGSLYDPTGPDPLIRTQQYMAIEDAEDLLDALESDRDRIQYLVEYEQDNPSATVLVDQWGNEYPNTPEFRQALDDMMIRTFEQKWAIHMAEGDADKASKEMLRKGTYITSHMQRHNTQDIKPVWNEVRDTAMKNIETAMLSGDPQTQIAAMKGAHRMVQNFVDDVNKKTTYSRGRDLTEEDDTPTPLLKRTKTARGREVIPDADLQEEMGWFTKFLGAASGKDAKDPDDIMKQLSEAYDSRPENIPWSKTDLEKLSIGDPDSGRMGIIEAWDSRVGLAQGTYSYVGQGPHMRPISNEELAVVRQEAEAQGGKYVATFDKGKIVYRPVEAGNNAYNIWVDEFEIPIPAARIAAMSPGEIYQQQQSGAMKELRVVEPWGTVTMSDGKRWFVDPETGLFYKTMPVKYKYDKTGRLVWDEAAGAPVTKFVPFAHAQGVAAPFAGMTPKQAQEMLRMAEAMGVIDPGSYFARDENGNTVFSNPNFEGMYWSQSDEIARQAMLSKPAVNVGGEKRARRPGQVSDGDGISRKRTREEEDDLAWEKRMLMVRRAEGEAFREDARLASLRGPESAQMPSVEEFASSMGIKIGGRDQLSDQQRTSLDRFSQIDKQLPKAPAAKLPPAQLAPVMDPKDRTPVELPRTPLPMANSREMIDLRDTREPTPTPKKAITPPKKIATNRKPTIR